MLMNKYISKSAHLILSVLISILFASCDYVENLTAESEIELREINSGTIKHIIVNSPCKLELLPESSVSSGKITIEGYSHLLDELQLKFINDSIVINHKKREYLQKSNLIKISIPANDLKRIVTFAVCELESPDYITPNDLLININGDGKFTNANLKIKSPSFRLYVWGTRNIGNYHVEGSATNASFLLEGCVSIDAIDFVADNISVNQKSIKDCYVCPKQKLTVKTYSSGNTYYSGSPEVTDEHVIIPYFSSTGNVLHIE